MSCDVNGSRVIFSHKTGSHENRVAFITGAAAGIGLGMARAFADKGMRLALADINHSQLEQAQQQLAQAGHRALIFPLDVCKRETLKAAMAETVSQHGALHVVCANAGVAGFIGAIDESQDNDWDWTIDVNLKGVVNTVQAALPHLLRNPRHAHIVLTSSISGLRVYDPSRGQGMYNTTKFALVGLAEALHVDLRDKGVGVSVLCPGVVNTDISNSGRNRPPQYGGPIDVHEDFVLAKAAKHGTDPLDYGRWVLKAMERDQLYVVTHPEDRAMVEARHARIMQAFDDCGSLISS